MTLSSESSAKRRSHEPDQYLGGSFILEKQGNQRMSIETSVESGIEGRMLPGAALDAPDDALAERYERDGYLAPFRVLAPEEAEGCWQRMQELRRERPEDAAIAFSFNPHYLLPWLYDLAGIRGSSTRSSGSSGRTSSSGPPGSSPRSRTTPRT